MAIPFLSSGQNPPEREWTSEEIGTYLVKLARNAIVTYLKEKKIIKPENPPKVALEKLGVFVSIETHPGGELKGLIGYPKPVKDLGQEIVECAINAAIGDPRFEPVKLSDMDHIVVEVSILTQPELLQVPGPFDYPRVISIGQDGLMVEHEIYSGLLLPQVPVQWNWSSEEFLNRTCDKAGLPQDCWKNKSIKVYKFQARVFAERSPNGNVYEKLLSSVRGSAPNEQVGKDAQVPEKKDEVSW